MQESDFIFAKAKEHFILGLDHILKEKWTKAEEELKASLQYIPNRLSTLTNLCATLIKLKKFQEASDLIVRTLALDSKNPELILSQGLLFSERCRYHDALASYNKAIELKPDYAEAWNNRGVALGHLKRYEEAFLSYQRSIELMPNNAEVWSNRGVMLRDLKRYEEALASYERAIKVNPKHAKSWSNRGVALNDLKHHEEALTCYVRAIELNPDFDFILGDLVHTQMKICDWVNLDRRRQILEEKILAMEKVTNSFAILGLFDNPELQKLCAEIYAKERLVLPSQPGVIEKRARPEKVRVGYFSADFHNHATMYLLAELFELHNKNHFEIYAFSFGQKHNDEMRRRVEKAVDQFFDVAQLSDSAIVALSREQKIDIAIDLKGNTKDSRPQIFAERAAPIQVSYLGYPGTLGTQYLDYLVADPILITADTEEAYSEKIIYLPHSYQANDSKRKVSRRIFLRQEVGLPTKGVIFCCFNNNWKIVPEIFDCWISILQSVDGSVLWLFKDNPTAAKNLIKEAEKRGVDPNRLVFAELMPHADHLARYKLASLFLDTFPYNAHTTASDALWAGVPVLTLQGRSFAARVAASLLSNIGVPELITHSKEAYVSLAIELALTPEKLTHIKAKLECNRLNTPLFNTKLLAKHIESAYQSAYDRYYSGLPPDRILVHP